MVTARRTSKSAASQRDALASALAKAEVLRAALKFTSMLYHGCDRHAGEFVDCEVGICEQARQALASDEAQGFAATASSPIVIVNDRSAR